MNYNNIIENGNLIYQSSQSDKKLQEWRIAQITCNVKYFQTEPLTELERIILCLLQSFDGINITKEELGLTLGFDIATKIFGSKRFYEDKAELQLYNSMIKSVFDWKLVVEESLVEESEGDSNIKTSSNESNANENKTKYIRLTKLGRLAIEKNCKFKFFSGIKTLFENINKSSNEVDSAFFPFYSELGIYSNIEKEKSILLYDGDKIDIEYEDDLIRRLKLQSRSELNLFWAEKTNSRVLSSKYVDIRLYKYDGEFYPIIFHNNAVSTYATDILYRKENIDLCTRKIKKALYCKLMSDSDSVINYDEIRFFEDEIEHEEFARIIQDNRTDWHDLQTYNFIVNHEYCNENAWGTISKLCPTDIIISHIKDNNSHFDINQISRRLPIDFIIDSCNTLHWEINIVLSREDITQKQAQRIMLCAPNKETEWDWDLTEQFLNLDFVLNNIRDLKVDYYKLTSWLPESNLELLIEYPERKWDWRYFVETANINLIIDNIDVVKEHVSAFAEKVLDRVFTNTVSTEKAIYSKDFGAALKSFQADNKLIAFNLEHKPNYIWGYNLIDYFESCNILIWNTDKIKKGFAQYPFIAWDEIFFCRYKNKINSEDDFSYISEHISSLKIVENNTDFQWNWSALSKNPTFASSEEFLSYGKEKVHYESWLKISQKELTYDFFSTHIQWLSSEHNSLFASNVIDKFDYVRDFETFPWNWKALAQNHNILNDVEFCDNLEHHREAIPNWLYYADFLNIEKYFHKLRVSELLDSKIVYNQEARDSMNISRSLKNRLSSILSPDFISDNLDYNWDIDIVSSRIVCQLENSPNTLEKYQNKLNWKILSNELDVEFIQNHINGFIDKWDWHTLTERLSAKFIYENFKLFFNFWDKSTIQRKLIPLLSSEDVLDEAKSNYWDWNLISENLPEHILFDILQDKAAFLNWRTISERICTIKEVNLEQIIQGKTEISNYLLWSILNNDMSLSSVIANKDVAYSNWDWHILTSRFDTDFIVDNLSTLAGYWDWDIILEKKLNREFLLNNLEKLKNAIANLSASQKEQCWKTISRLYSPKELIELCDELSPHNGYYWDYSYVYQAIQDPEQYIDASHPYVDWSAFSSCAAVDKMFEYDQNIFVFRAWKAMIKKKLNSDKFNWNYSELTKLNSVQKRHDVFYMINPEKWDWDYISRHGSCLLVANNRDKYLRKYRNRLSFPLISLRGDIEIDNELIESFIDENWDWKELSSNEQTSITLGFICSHIEKPWSWNLLSKNHSIKWSNNYLLKLLNDPEIKSDISWDDIVAKQEITFDDELLSKLDDISFSWYALTSNPSYHPSIEKLQQAINSGETVNWHSISSNKFIDLDFVRHFKNSLDWDVLTSNTNIIDLNQKSIIDEFCDKLNWSYVSQMLELSTNSIVEYKDFLNWDIVNNRFNYNDFDLSLIDAVKDNIDWTKLSSSSVLFTEDFLYQYRDRIDWYEFSKNESIDFTADLYSDFTRELNRVQFVSILANSNSYNYTPLKVYHFSHLFNAINIIKSRKILSRNKAERLNSLKYDAAGAVVHRTNKAHPYARFYFRPQSPTQFYNECLGWDSSLKTNWYKPKSYYPQACNLHLPKCPMPIFFEFDIREIISKMPEKCYYSTGNLQTNFANVIKVEDVPDRIRTEYLYRNLSDAFDMARDIDGCYNPENHHYYMGQIKEQSQQEFLILDEFDFSTLNSFTIYCFDEFQKELLKQLLGNDKITTKIKVGNHNMYSRNNRQLEMLENTDSITISSDYDLNGCAYLLVKGGTILNTSDIKNKTVDGAIIYPTVTFSKENPPKEIYFVDPNPMADTKKWLIYSSSINESIQPQKFKINELVQSAVNTFVSNVEELPIRLSKNMFYPHMLNSYHGIAHTARVVFATHLLAHSVEMTDEERMASYIAAIIHDLGKQNDTEGAEHGYNSMLLYKDKILNLIKDEYLANRILNAVRYHSVEDNNCPSEVKKDILWKLLKDADALDRSRFSGRGCDKSYLRLWDYNDSVGKNILELTKYLPAWTSNLKWDNPYQELIDVISKYCY